MTKESRFKSPTKTIRRRLNGSVIPNVETKSYSPNCTGVEMMIRLHPIAYNCGALKLLAILLLCGSFSPSWAVPSFARQTGMTCAACHTVFPELTPFGREFKLNGYVLDNIRQVTGIDTADRQTLAINSIPPVSAMLQVSYTHTSKALPDSALAGDLAKDGEVLFPQQVSLFYAGKIADGLGAFMQ